MTEIIYTALPEMIENAPRRLTDYRSFLAEMYSLRTYPYAGVQNIFLQDNHSQSVAAGAERGLHFQAPPHAQAKLVRCGQGAIFDVPVDIRRGSQTYGRWAGCNLSAANGAQLYIPAEFAHGFASQMPDSEIVHKCSDYYAPETEGSLRLDDAEIGSEWPLSNAPVLSERDAHAPLLADF